MKLIWWMMAALGAATVAGCTVGPDYQAPAVAVPAEWSRTGMGAEPAHQADWWVTLQDPILTALEERAAQANLDLRLAAARVREARAARGIADASRLPMVGAQGGYTRTRLSPDSPIGPLIPNPNFGDWVAGFDASWELDLFGRVRRSVEAADAELAATEEGARDVLVTVQAEVARDYIELRSAQQRLGIAEGTLASERNPGPGPGERSRAGLAADFDVTRAQAETSATEAELPRLREEITESVYAMGVLLGREPMRWPRSCGGPRRFRPCRKESRPASRRTCCGGGPISGRRSGGSRPKMPALAWRKRTIPPVRPEGRPRNRGDPPRPAGRINSRDYGVSAPRSAGPSSPRARSATMSGRRTRKGTRLKSPSSSPS